MGINHIIDNEIRDAVFVGMNFYDMYKDSKIVFGNYELLDNDKKFLCLYYGLICSDNKISKKLTGKKYKPFDWSNSENIKRCVSIYEQNEFEDIFKNLEFQNVEDYYRFLKVQKCINEHDKIYNKSKSKIK